MEIAVKEAVIKIMIRFTNLDEFDKTLNRIAQKIEVSGDIILRKIGFDLFAGFTKRTPVDTGYARANWLITTGGISTETFNKTEFPSGVNNEAKARQINNSMQRSIRPDKNRTTLFITNSVSYITFLEAGHSKQIDKGFMVQRTLADVTENLKIELDNLDNEL